MVDFTLKITAFKEPGLILFIMDSEIPVGSSWVQLDCFDLGLIFCCSNLLSRALGEFKKVLPDRMLKIVISMLKSQKPQHTIPFSISVLTILILLLS